MSDYCKEKVLRVPLDKYGFTSVEDFEKDLEKRDRLKYLDYAKIDSFQIAPTERLFLDLVISYSYGDDCSEYGKTRALYDSEKLKYHIPFGSMLPGIDMNDVRLVEFCWYNCSEAPDYYDEENDDFYKEV